MSSKSVYAMSLEGMAERAGVPVMDMLDLVMGDHPHKTRFTREKPRFSERTGSTRVHRCEGPTVCVQVAVKNPRKGQHRVQYVSGCCLKQALRGLQYVSKLAETGTEAGIVQYTCKAAMSWPK